jgi:hypothetical protein
VLWRNWRYLENKALYNIETDARQERDVAAENPDVVTKLRAGLDQWWDGLKDRVNEPQRVIIGAEAEDPTLITACEWWDVFVDQQGQVRRGVAKNGVWHLEIAQAGTYEIELRRWPREAALALSAAPPSEKVWDGTLVAGKALPIAGARVDVQGASQRVRVASNEQSAIFRIPLHAGPATLQTWFLQADDTPICGAYYVYIDRQE